MSSYSSYHLALDQSTSASKALIFDERGGLIAQTARNHQQYYPQTGWVEHDAEEIYQNSLAVLRELVAAHPDKAPQTLSITNQRETFLIFDAETGAPLYNAIVWQCRRGEPLCQSLIDAGHNPEVLRITGLKLDTYFPASKIAWLLNERPDLKKRLEDGSAKLGTIDAYLVYRLTLTEPNGAIFATDPSNACRTLLYDIEALAWSTPLCDLFGIPINALPEVHECAAHFGTTTLEGALAEPLPIIGIMGDSQAVLFAEQCFSAGSVKVTFGTGSSILMNSGPIRPPQDENILTTLAWVQAGQPTYALEGIINFSGATIAWMRDQMRYIDTPAETETLAQAVEDNGGVYLVPAFVGLSAPHWQPNARAAILGLSPSSTKNHIVRAALESIAYQVRDVLELMAGVSGLQLAFVQADGGMVNNRFLMQFTADMTNLALRASRLPELSALGAVMMGYLGAGLYPDMAALADLPHEFSSYQPNMSAERRAQFAREWAEAVRRVL